MTGKQEEYKELWIIRIIVGVISFLVAAMSAQNFYDHNDAIASIQIFFSFVYLIPVYLFENSFYKKYIKPFQKS